MTIKEIEQMTGLTRSVIRYYEKEKLIDPIRNASNGYRDYSEEDVENIRKIAYLRTLGISVEDIRRLINHEADLYRIVKKQKQTLEQQMSDLETRKACVRECWRLRKRLIMNIWISENTLRILRIIGVKTEISFGLIRSASFTCGEERLPGEY